MASGAQLKEEVAQLRLISDTFNAKFIDTDQEVAKIKAHCESLEPKFAKYDQMASTWKPQVEAILEEHNVGHKAMIEEQAKTLAQLRGLYEITDKTLSETNAKLMELERRSVGPQSDAASRMAFEKKWQLTRPKDMEAGTFSGKDEEWPKWKEEMEDYIESVHPGLKVALTAMAKTSSEVTQQSLVSHDPPFGREEWALSESLFVLLKRKTSIEARNVVMCVERMNGFEAWRLLTGRFEAGTGIRRMKEIAELNALQNKRCKNAAETSLILLEVDRRKRLIEEIGGQVPSHDTLVNVLWVAMDPGTKSHVSGKLDAAEVQYAELKQAIMKHISLVGATSGAGKPSTAMDIGSISSVTDAGVEPSFDAPSGGNEWPNTDEAGWSIDEEGYPVEGYFDGQFNFVEGGGKGKGFSGAC